MIDNVTTHWTREMAASSTRNAPNTVFPEFDISQVEALVPDTDIWDSWFVMDEDNQVASVFGFKVLVALGFSDDEDQKPKLMYFFSHAYEDFYMFGGVMLTEKLVDECEEWSGCTLLRRDGRLQTFYTVNTGMETDGLWQSDQRFATVIQRVVIEDDFMYLESPDYHDIIFHPEHSNGFYQTTKDSSDYEHRYPHEPGNWGSGNAQVDNFCFRDPKFYRDPHDGVACLLFEANTGSALWSGCDEDGARRECIGSEAYARDYRPTRDALKANGCLGLVILNEDYTQVTEVAKPVLAAQLVADEIERANIIEHDGYYYLFFVCHGNKMAIDDDELVNRDMLVGFRSERPAAGIRDLMTQTLQPLNGNGVVLQQKFGGERFGGQKDNEQYVYSWMVMPDLSVICYSYYSTSDEGEVDSVHSAGPVVQLEINGTETKVTQLRYDIHSV